MSAHEAAGMPPLLHFESEPVADGRDLDPPSNFRLLRVTRCGTDALEKHVRKGAAPVIAAGGRCRIHRKLVRAGIAATVPHCGWADRSRGRRSGMGERRAPHALTPVAHPFHASIRSAAGRPLQAVLRRSLWGAIQVALDEQRSRRRPGA